MQLCDNKLSMVQPSLYLNITVGYTADILTISALSIEVLLFRVMIAASHDSLRSSSNVGCLCTN